MEETRTETRRWTRAILGYLCVALPLAFLWLGSRDVFVMEGIVADGARFMERTGELAVPHLHSEVYNYKPPGAYWMALASGKVFGIENEWSLRFPFALSGVLMGLAVLLVAGTVLGPRGGFVCAVASVTVGLVLRKLQLAEWDVALAAGVGLAVAVACRNLAVARPSAALWILGYLGLGFGFLVKGAPALLFFFPGLFAAAYLTGRVRHLLRPGHLAGVACFVFSVGAWILAAAAAEGWEVFSQPLLEAGDKGLGWTWARAARALKKPFSIPILFLPWALMLPIVAKREWWRALASQDRALAQSAASFAVLGVGIFTIMPAHETRYFLPLCVPLGILFGVALCRVTDNPAWSKITGGGAVALAVIAGLATIALGVVNGLVRQGGPGERALAVTVGLATLALVVARVRSGRREVFAMLLAATLCYWLINRLAADPRSAEKRSLRSVAEVFEPHLEVDETLWTTPVAPGFHHSSLFFYLRRPVRTVTATERPAAGAHVVFFSDEPENEPDWQPPFEYSVLASDRRRGFEFTLAIVK